MKPLHRVVVLALLSGVFAHTTKASELSYTFMDFRYVQQDVNVIGSQVNPGTGQTVDIDSEKGDGVAVAGSLAIGDHFFLSGSYRSAIIDVNGVITNDLGVTEVSDNYDLIASRVALGYLLEFGDNFDLIAELSYDTSEYDFGSFATENFDIVESGAGVGLGFRWNPTPRLELSMFGRSSSVGEVSLDTLEFDSDTSVSFGILWYFIDDLGLGIDFESSQIDTVTISMRFSFGNLPW